MLRSLGFKIPHGRRPYSQSMLVECSEDGSGEKDSSGAGVVAGAEARGMGDGAAEESGSVAGVVDGAADTATEALFDHGIVCAINPQEHHVRWRGISRRRRDL